MATKFRLHTQEWHQWIGPPPVLEKTVANPFVRPGLDGTGVIRVGRHGRPFQRQLIAFYNTYDLAHLGTREIDNLTKLDFALELVYDNVNYKTIFQTSYFLLDVEHEVMRTCIFVSGIGYACGMLVSTLTLLPHNLTKPKPKTAGS